LLRNNSTLREKTMTNSWKKADRTGAPASPECDGAGPFGTGGVPVDRNAAANPISMLKVIWTERET
jgi:hypothetical protein